MTDVMDRLRIETQDLHASAERQEFQQRMVRGALSREEYAAWLQQMYLIHRTLETVLEPLIDTDPRFAAVTRRQLQEPYLLADLAALGIDPVATAPLPAAADLVDRIVSEVATERLRLLGYHYVLEGSNNGNRFIARALLPALGLERAAGGLYLDPYGAEQPELWQAFKREMSSISFTVEEVDTLVAAARRMFSAIEQLSTELAGRRRVVA